MAIGELSFITILKNELEKEVKSTIVRELTNKYVKDFEAELRQSLNDKLSKVTFDKIESLRDLMDLREEVIVHIKGPTDEQ